MNQTEELLHWVRTNTIPAGALVISDASGRWFHWQCNRCQRRGQAAKDKKLIQARADQHNEGCGQ